MHAHDIAIDSERALRRFYRHLVVSTAAQVGVLVVAAAVGAVALWCAAVLLAALLLLCAHASLSLAPRVRFPRTDRGPGRT